MCLPQTASLLISACMCAQSMLNSHKDFEQATGRPEVWCAAQGLEEVRVASGTWEAQAQSGLAQVERLKDLLEETARWSPVGAHRDANPVRVAAERAAAGAAADGGEAAAEPAAAPVVGSSAPAEAVPPGAESAAVAGAAQAAEVAAAAAERQRAEPADAEAAGLRRACAQLEEQLRWQRAAAASAPPLRMPDGLALPTQARWYVF